MKRRFLILFLLLVCGEVHAQSALFGKRLVSKGDDTAHVRNIAGAPDKLDTIPADQYSPAMEIWTYRRKDSTIALWIVAGKVVQVQEQVASQSGGSASSSSSATR
jgi:hypothetical protein